MAPSRPMSPRRASCPMPCAQSLRRSRGCISTRTASRRSGTTPTARCMRISWAMPPRQTRNRPPPLRNRAFPMPPSWARSASRRSTIATYSPKTAMPTACTTRTARLCARSMHPRRRMGPTCSSRSTTTCSKRRITSSLPSSRPIRRASTSCSTPRPGLWKRWCRFRAMTRTSFPSPCRTRNTKNS